MNSEPKYTVMGELLGAPKTAPPDKVAGWQTGGGTLSRSSGSVRERSAEAPRLRVVTPKPKPTGDEWVDRHTASPYPPFGTSTAYTQSNLSPATKKAIAASWSGPVVVAEELATIDGLIARHKDATARLVANAHGASMQHWKTLLRASIAKVDKGLEGDTVPDAEVLRSEFEIRRVKAREDLRGIAAATRNVIEPILLRIRDAARAFVDNQEAREKAEAVRLGIQFKPSAVLLDLVRFAARDCMAQLDAITPGANPETILAGFHTPKAK